jgi:hypothetical protein
MAVDTCLQPLHPLLPDLPLRNSNPVPMPNPVPVRASSRLHVKHVAIPMACRCDHIVDDTEKGDSSRIVSFKAAGECETIWVSI